MSGTRGARNSRGSMEGWRKGKRSPGRGGEDGDSEDQSDESDGHGGSAAGDGKGTGGRPRDMGDLSDRLSSKVSDQNREIRELRQRLRAAEEAAMSTNGVSAKEHRELVKQLGQVSRECRGLQMQLVEEQVLQRRLRGEVERAEIELAQARGHSAATDNALSEMRYPPFHDAPAIYGRPRRG